MARPPHPVLCAALGSDGAPRPRNLLLSLSKRNFTKSESVAISKFFQNIHILWVWDII